MSIYSAVQFQLSSYTTNKYSQEVVVINQRKCWRVLMAMVPNADSAVGF